MSITDTSGRTITTTDVIWLRGYVPPELKEKFLRAVREFDLANDGCHFQICVMAEELTDVEIEKMLQNVDPERRMYLRKVWERK